MQKLQQFVNNHTFVHKVLPSTAELMELLRRKRACSVSNAPNEEITLFYGETFDEFGMTLDSLQYYFVLSLLHHYLLGEGYNVKSFVVQADVASVLNKSSQKKSPQLETQLQSRLRLLQKIIATYNLLLKVELMSNLFQTQKYKTALRVVDEFAQTQPKDSDFYIYLKQTVLRNRLKQESETEFQYAREAIATSMLFDIKLGPPREEFYDRAQHLLAQYHTNISSDSFIKKDSLVKKQSPVQPIRSIYLIPSYPLGQNFAFFLSNPEIEEFGLTPYKAGSNKLQHARIVLGSTNPDQVKGLILDSFESSNPQTIHPVLRAFVIGDLAKRLLCGDVSLPTYAASDVSHDIPRLKRETIDLIQKYVLEPLLNHSSHKTHSAASYSSKTLLT